MVFEEEGEYDEVTPTDGLQWQPLAASAGDVVQTDLDIRLSAGRCVMGIKQAKSVSCPRLHVWRARAVLS
jgi:hypothetical protein